MLTLVKLVKVKGIVYTYTNLLMVPPPQLVITAVCKKTLLIVRFTLSQLDNSIGSIYSKVMRPSQAVTSFFKY